MSFKVDYSELVTALQDNRHGPANRLLKELRPRLEKFLIIGLGASPPVAEDIVQEALANTYLRIMGGGIDKDKYIFKYLINTCRFGYYRYKQYGNPFEYEQEDAAKVGVAAPQLEYLIDKDRQRVLAECIEALPKKKRELITYVFEHPSVTSMALSDRFDIKASTVRVMKSRIIDALGQCARRKLDL